MEHTDYPLPSAWAFERQTEDTSEFTSSSPARLYRQKNDSRMRNECRVCSNSEYRKLIHHWEPVPREAGSESTDISDRHMTCLCRVISHQVSRA
jgi:hypothetical protein